MADAHVLFTLQESAAGYALFEVVAFDEIGGLLADTADAVTDLARFGRAVKLKAFAPFASAAEALDNANALSEHALPGTLHNFLELHLPQSNKSSSSKKKTSAFTLGVIDPGLAAAIGAGLPGVTCRSDDTVREIGRGCRLHLDTFVRGLHGAGSSGNSSHHTASVKAQLGLGHAYSRSKVKFNPARSDNMIIQSIALLDQLDKDVNTFAMRVREWYSWHFPELKDVVKDSVMFARAAAFIQDKATLFHSSRSADSDDNDDDDERNGGHGGGANDKMPGLTEIVGDADTADLIVAAAKTSMGMDCSAIDMLNIVNFTQRLVKMAAYRRQLQHYLAEKMTVVAPNLSALIGDAVAARLISKVLNILVCARAHSNECAVTSVTNKSWCSHSSRCCCCSPQAGSLTNLAKAPASTVQILGAEKALFRALKTKGNTPKYGLIYHSTFIGRAEAKNKGRISRYLANKCSIATRIDSFADAPNALYGIKLRAQVEERLQFYETGAAPRRNIDVMEEAARELRASKGDDNDDDENDAVMKDASAAAPASDKKKKKKDKKRKSVDADDGAETLAVVADKKSKRKSVDVNDNDGDDDNDDNNEAAKKAAKKAKKEKKKKKSL